MMFCPKCGSMLRIKAGKASCSCGYSSRASGVVVEMVERKRVGLGVSGEDNLFATESHVCKKCGFGKAVLVAPPPASRETWNSGEADRSSYVCGRCGFREFID